MIEGLAIEGLPPDESLCQCPPGNVTAERMKKMTIRQGAIALCALGAMLFAMPAGPAAQQEEQEQASPEASETMRPRPDLSQIDQIRFLTDSDYPPFNYLDEEGALTGFNVDLARALCEELVVDCDVRSVDWSQLVTALENGETDAVVASIRVSRENLVQLDFTDAYYHMPARFVALKEKPFQDTSPEALTARRIAVVAGTAHQAYLKDFFSGSQIVTFESNIKAEEALRAGEVDLVFGDGIALMFWLNGTASENCCEFRGGAYSDSKYFGEGIGIAVRRGNRQLRTVLDYGLERLRINGRLEELYLRYFPLSFF